MQSACPLKMLSIWTSLNALPNYKIANLSNLKSLTDTMEFSFKEQKTLEEKKKMLVSRIFFISHYGFKSLFLLFLKFMIVWQKVNPFPNDKILDCSKLREFADNKFKFYENGRMFLKTGRKHCGKRRNCSL